MVSRCNHDRARNRIDRNVRRIVLCPEDIAIDADSPLISVIMTAYNDENYIRDAISGMLDQTIEDLEIIIVDDGSRDDTGTVVKEFDDARIRYMWQANQGVSGAVNTGIMSARGQYIAFTNGDALNHPERLARQLQAHDDGGGRIVFVNAHYIDDAGEPATKAYWPIDFFCIPPMSRGEIVERFFLAGNFFPTFTMFGPTELFRRAGLFDTTLQSLSDYDYLWRLIRQTNFVVIHERLASWRLRTFPQNLSSPTLENRIRSNIETYLILRNALDETPRDLLIEAFGKRFVNPDPPTDGHLACELAFLCARNPFGYTRLIGSERLHALLRDPRTARILESDFNFGPRDFIALNGTLDVLNFARDDAYKKLVQEYEALRAGTSASANQS